MNIIWSPDRKLFAYVESSQENHHHMVDLIGNPHSVDTTSCTCKDFIRCRRNRKNNPDSIIHYCDESGKRKDRTRCKHIDAAERDYMRLKLRLEARKQR